MINKPGKNKHPAFAAITVLLCSLLVFIGGADTLLADRASIFEGEELSVPTYATAEFENAQVSGFCSHTSAEIKVLGVGFKEIPINVYKNIRLCPGGNAFGVKMKTKGVIVVGMNDVQGHSENPAYTAGIRIGDIITSVNDISISTADDITEIVNESAGAPLMFEYLRDGKIQTTTVTPIADTADGRFKTGIWVRDSTAGIGTVTYIDPNTGDFGGLGHGICDMDTGVLLPLEKGELYDVVISGVNKGNTGAPGELRGFFVNDKKGIVYSNTDCGVFGKTDMMPKDISEPIPIALRDEVKTGTAQLICTTDENQKTAYDIQIQKIFDQSTNTKNFIVKVTDPRLLEKTGGIVQGMSGSPIIQDGKLVGAVTHVLVNDLTRGYGIFIENMLNASQTQI